MRTEKKQKLARKRRWRVRQKISGTQARPRMAVCFTNKNIHVQFIDDTAGVTLAAASTTSKATPDRDKLAANAASAKIIGRLGGPGRLEQGHQASGFRPRRRPLPWQSQGPGRGRARGGPAVLTFNRERYCG